MLNKITSFAEYLEKYQESIADPEGFWTKIAETHFWRKKWDRVLDWRFDGEGAPDVNWFVSRRISGMSFVSSMRLPTMISASVRFICSINFVRKTKPNASSLNR